MSYNGPLPQVVKAGGTGDTSFTAYAPIVGGTSTTGPLQQATSGISTSGFVLTSQGASSLPIWTNIQAEGAVTILHSQDGNDVTPTAGAINISGSGSLTTTGTSGPNTLTTALTGLTNHNVLVGAGTSTITKVAPSATSGIPLISQGASADPLFGTAVVAGGGTGNTTFTAYSVITAGTTATGAFQNVSGVGTAGQVLTSSGAAALPVWANPVEGTWTSITTNTALVANTGYFVTSGALSLTLPTGSIGQTIRVALRGGTSWTIALSGNTIYYGNNTLTTSLASTLAGDSIELVCSAANAWVGVSAVGNLTGS